MSVAQTRVSTPRAQPGQTDQQQRGGSGLGNSRRREAVDLINLREQEGVRSGGGLEHIEQR
jgi:hypothetical protein